MNRNILLFFFAFASIFSFAQTSQKLSPDFTAITLDNDTIVLSDILLNEQKYVAVEFFFNESPVCQEVSPLITDAFLNLGLNQTDVVFISVNVDNDSTQCREYMNTFGLQTPIVAGTKGGNEISEAYDIQSFPTLILISPSIPDTLIALDSTIITDTIVVPNSISGENDTTFIYHDYPYNIVENDIWPILTAEDILSTLTSYNGITSISDPFIKSAYSTNLYPNPNDGTFKIQAVELNGLYNYQIIDIAGKIVSHGEISLQNKQAVTLNVNWLKSGIYFLKLQNDHIEISEKIIIQ